MQNFEPTKFLQMTLPAKQAAEINQVALDLTVAIGSAMAAF